MTQSKCLICGVRPVNRPRFRCGQCHARLEAEVKRERKQVEFNRPALYVTYHDVTVSLHKRDDRYAVKPCLRDVTKLPRGRTLDLNGYVAGFTRDQVKKIKAVVLSTLPQIPVMRD